MAVEGIIIILLFHAFVQIYTGPSRKRPGRGGSGIESADKRPRITPATTQPDRPTTQPDPPVTTNTFLSEVIRLKLLVIKLLKSPMKFNALS